MGLSNGYEGNPPSRMLNFIRQEEENQDKYQHKSYNPYNIPECYSNIARIIFWFHIRHSNRLIKLYYF